MARVVLPSVRLFFPCEQAVLEIDDEGEPLRWVLTRPLHTAFLPSGIVENFEQEEIWFYAQLVGGVGKFKLSVALSTEDGYWVKRSDTEVFNFSNDPLTVREFVFHMTSVHSPTPDITNSSFWPTIRNCQVGWLTSMFFLCDIMASKNKKIETAHGGSGPTSVIHPVIELDCSDWSADIPSRSKTKGRFRFRSQTESPPAKKPPRKKKVGR